MPALPADTFKADANRKPKPGRRLAETLRAMLDRLVAAQRDVAPEFFRHPFP